MHMSEAPPPNRRRWPAWLALALSLPLGACSILSPLPSWELLKAAGSAASVALANKSPAKASQTVHHGDAPVDEVCIEFNPEAQAPELVPALQAELRVQRVHSRVYESGAAQPLCRYWLRYLVSTQWDQPPLYGGYRSYVSALSLSLHRADGQLMSSSSYSVDEGLGIGRWASTRAKLAPVVRALITGFES
jgi:hypothetical protein